VLSHLAPARRRLVLGVGALLIAVLATGGVLSLRSDTHEAVDQARPGPVLLVPGYGGSVASLSSLRATLRAAGRDVTVVGLPDRALGDLADQARVLGSAVDAALARTGADSVDVLGYSAGGVVARIWVIEEGGAGRVRRLVTLGSPNHGTDLAELGALVQGTCSVACQQLSPTSPVLARLNAEPLPPGPEYLSLWTTRDDVVLPPDSAIIDGVSSPSLQSICVDSQVRHSGLPDDPLVQRLVAEAFGSGMVPTWGPGDCTRLRS
jgi:triacylglycerol lipase